MASARPAGGGSTAPAATIPPAAKCERGGNQRHERRGLERARDVLDQAARAYAAPLDDGEHGGDNGGHRGGASAQGRHQRTRELADDDRDGGGGAAGRNPVAPTDDEAGIFAERVARKDVLAAGTRNHRPELRDLDGAEQRVEAARGPDGEEEPGVRQVPGDFARRAEDAGADRVADRDGQAEADAEHAQQPAAPGRARAPDAAIRASPVLRSSYSSRWNRCSPASRRTDRRPAVYARERSPRWTDVQIATSSSWICSLTSMLARLRGARRFGDVRKVEVEDHLGPVDRRGG